MSTSKGQASLMDIVMLATAISVVLVVGTFFNSQQQINAQQAREWSIYSQAELITVSQYRTDFSSIIPGLKQATLTEALSLWFCDPSVNNTPFETWQPINNFLNSITPENYFYIYYAEDKDFGGAFSININNGQGAVCAKEIPLASQEVSYQCVVGGSERNITFLFGMWPKWKKYPISC